MNQTEEELEKFRKAWRDEVSTRRGPQHSESRPEQSSASESRPKPARNPKPIVGLIAGHHDTEIEPHTYHDVEEKDSGRRLGDEKPSVVETGPPSPISALEHYERAVEKEGQGNLGESLAHYRKAFKLDPRVQDKYKTKHFPPHTQGNKLAPQSYTAIPGTAQSLPTQSVADLINEFAELDIVGQEPPTELSPKPPCPISKIPDEILLEILLAVAVTDVASYARLAQVCKRLAYLIFKEDRIWRRIALGQEHGFAGMHYGFACSIEGSFLSDGGGIITSMDLLQAPHVPLLLTDSYLNYRQMFRSRPRIRFHGCYISTVNYTRPGANGFNTVSWNAPILIVTYFRYLRFFRDGTVISLLTTAEPADVVPYLHKEHAHKHHQPGSSLPQVIMKDARSGRWRLSGDPYGTKLQRKALLADSVDEDGEAEGELIVETEGVVPYTYRMNLAFGSAGRGARNNKLSWKGFWSYNKLADDWGEFGLKNYRPFFWSRVRSYGNGF